MERRSLRQAGAATGDALQLAQHPLERGDRAGEKGELVLDLGDGVRQLTGPGGSGTGDAADQGGERYHQQGDREHRADGARHADAVGDADEGLQQQLQDDRQHDGQDDRRGDVECGERGEKEQAAEEDRARIGGERHGFAFLADRGCGCGVTHRVDCLVDEPGNGTCDGLLFCELSAHASVPLRCFWRHSRERGWLAGGSPQDCGNCRVAGKLAHHKSVRGAGRGLGLGSRTERYTIGAMSSRASLRCIAAAKAG